MFAFRAAPSLQPSSLNPIQQTHCQYFPKSPHLHSLLFSPNPSLRSPQTPLSFSPNNNLNSPTTSPINNNPSIQSLSKQGKLKEALKLLSNEPNPNQQTFEFLILACSKANDLDNGRFVHRRLVRDGFEQDPFLATKLINFYSDCKSLNEARTVFNGIENKTLFVYNALIRGLTLLGNSEEALSLYQKMYLDGVEFDQFTFPYILKACVVASASSLQGKEIHGHVLRRGFESDVYITTTLIDVYGKFGCLGYARHVFNKMPMRNVVSWSAMIASYARNNRNFEALDLFGKMMVEEKTDFVPNSVTMVSVLQACGSLVALQQGKLIHGYILRRELDSIVSVVNSLVTMYAKCGSVGTARWVFDRMERRDVVSWNSMISGYGIHGFGREAIWVFEEMIQQGVSPTPVTFVSVLGACSHVGLVREGQRLFDSMINDYGIVPSTEHYASMIDLLGRAGQLSKAAEIIETMPIDPCPAVWGALLGSCRIHGSVELAERASHCLFELEPLNAGNYVLLADIYATYEMWEDVDRVKKTLEARGLQKVAGCSWIEVKKKIYSFVSVDEINPHVEQLHAFLVQLLTEMKERGYIPNTRVVLYDLDQEEKERIVLGHSEKLALAFGLINSSNGETIRITKNLRLCEDCHSVTKFISKFADREILVRDVNRFHHFRDGVCSCADYW